MTPTLIGRWQTRLLIYVFVALPVTALFSYLIMDLFWPFSGMQREVPFYFVTAIFLVGLPLDVVYMQIQRFRWDQDWPFAFQFFFGIVEFALVFALVRWGILINFVPQNLDQWLAVTHFSLVFIPSFLAVLGLIQIFMVRWRFKGGELGRM